MIKKRDELEIFEIGLFDFEKLTNSEKQVFMTTLLKRIVELNLNESYGNCEKYNDCDDCNDRHICSDYITSDNGDTDNELIEVRL